MAVYALAIRQGAPLGRFAGATMGLVYLLHGAVIVGVDQLAVSSSSVYLGYAIGVAVVVVITPRQAVAIYALGVAAFVAALQLMQPDHIARMASMPPGISISVIAVTLSVFLYVGRRRDFVLQATIDRQRSELEALNVGLEARVQAAVAETLTRSHEVEALNAQLQANIRDRSAVLTQALAKLALQHTLDGSIRPGTVLGERFEVKRPATWPFRCGSPRGHPCC